MHTLEAVWMGNTLRQWLTAAGAAAATLAVLVLALRLVRSRLAALASRTKTVLDDLVVRALGRTTKLFLALIALRAGAAVLDLPAGAAPILRAATALIVLLQAGMWTSAVLTGWFAFYTSQKHAGDRAAITTMGAVSFAARLVVWVIVVLMALENLGVNVTTFVTGLGVGGVAVALAVQNILGDLFASLSIVLDKPFMVGDFLVVGEYQGSVEHVGLKTTRLRSLGGEQLVFANGELIKSRLRNYGRMAERRVVFTIGVTYQTPRAKLAAIPGMIRTIIEGQPGTRFDRSHFAAYGDFALNIETVYYVLTADYNHYMDIQQAINLQLHERFEAEAIEFAFPTQTLFIERASRG